MTEIKALQQSISMWAWLVKNFPLNKRDYPLYDEIQLNKGECPLCQYQFTFLHDKISINCDGCCLAKETSNKVLDAIEKAIKTSLPQTAERFLTIRENVSRDVHGVCDFEARKYVKESACDDFSKTAIIIRIIK